MYRTFDNDPSRPTRAQQVWQILVARATNRQTLTYGQLAKIVGFEGAGVFAQILGHIMYYCRQNKLPPLTIVVVNEDTGLPGEGLTQEDLNAGREGVFKFGWFSVVPPSPTELEAAYRFGHK